MKYSESLKDGLQGRGISMVDRVSALCGFRLKFVNWYEDAGRGDTYTSERQTRE